MRCTNCLQTINNGLLISISEHPQGALRITCDKCGFAEAYLVVQIPKQKTVDCKIKSVYEQ